MACISVGRLNARNALDASVMLLLSRAFWLVCNVATHCTSKQRTIQSYDPKAQGLTNKSLPYHFVGRTKDDGPRQKGPRGDGTGNIAL